MLGIVNNIKEIDCCAWDSIPEEVLLSSQPVVLRGLVADWPIVAAANGSTAQTIAYLKKFDSGRPLTAMEGDADIDGRIFYNDDFSGFNFDYRRMSLAQVFEKLVEYQGTDKPPMIYVGSTNIDNWLPGFRDENDLVLGDRSPLASLWIGNRSRVAPHYDFPTNIACSVAGRRRFTLFPPEQLHNMYVGPIDRSPAGQPISLVDLADPDYQRFPKFEQALQASQAADLEPGDAILIPSMWWHHVEAMDSLNVLVNYWWRSTPNFMGPPLAVLQHAILGLRDLPHDQRAVWKDLFDYYVFNPSEENVAHIPESARGALNPITEQTAQQIRGLLLEKFKH